MKYIDVVDERIRVLASIKDNWYTDDDLPNGIGKSFSKEGLEWFREFWLKYFEDKTDMEPYIYPTVDGEIQIEWNTFNRVADSQLVVNPETKIGTYYVFSGKSLLDEPEFKLEVRLENIDLTNEDAIYFVTHLCEMCDRLQSLKEKTLMRYRNNQL